jgi:hypothetical protein
MLTCAALVVAVMEIEAEVGAVLRLPSVPTKT